MVVILAKVLWAWWYDPTSVFSKKGSAPVPLIRITNGNTTGLNFRGPEGPEMPQIRSLATIAASVLALYLGLKVVDLFLHGGWNALIAGTWESWLYGIELALTAVIPVLLIALPKIRRSPVGIGIAAGSAAIGLALNRLDVGIFGYFRDAGEMYFPSLIEWAVGIGVIAAAGLAFFFATEHLPIFGDRPPVRTEAGLFRLSFGSLQQLWKTALTDGLHRVTLLTVFAIPLAFVLMYPPYNTDQTGGQTVLPATGIDVTRSTLRIDGNDGGVFTVFAHADHQKRLGDSTSCGNCHHVSMPDDQSTPCSRCHQKMNAPSSIFDHEKHLASVAAEEKISGWRPENRTCVKCHEENAPKTASGAINCMKCHEQDMFPSGKPAIEPELKLANSYREAMHRTCIECHVKEAARVDKPHLGECRTCHESLRARPMPQPSMAHVTGEPHVLP